MPQSLNHVIIHYIFSTKDRQAFLVPDVRTRLHAYLATVCRDMDAEAYRVGGVADHVHVLATLPRTVTQAVGMNSTDTPAGGRSLLSKCQL